MEKTRLDLIEEKAKEAFKKFLENSEYDFEVAELKGYIEDGTLETVYKQAFFAGYWQGEGRLGRKLFEANALITVLKHSLEDVEMKAKFTYPELHKWEKEKDEC